MAVPLWVDMRRNLSTLPKTGNRLRFILVCRGAGIAHIHGQRVGFTAPIVFCLNEREDFVLDHAVDLETRMIFFHPEFINAAFTLENIYGPDDEFRWSERSDRAWLSPFVDRDSNYHGYLTTGTATARRLTTLWEAISKELIEQNDHFWACRSRSFFLELLFLVARVYNNPNASDTVPLSGEPTEIDTVILYLHSNYRQKMTIAELTKAFNMNRTALNAKFTKVTGLSIMSYLIKLRINLAAVLLRDTTLPMDEIIDRTGFNDISHFHRMFKKHMGDTPSAYRQKTSWLAG